MRIVLLGAPGAGKGTQCKRIVDRYGVSHLSSGDILRRHRAEGSELGKKAQAYMDSGALVPDELVVEMMAREIENVAATGFVLDGFPRTVNQAIKLDETLASINQNIDIVVNLQVDEENVLARLTGRRSCPKCGAVYHVENMRPNVEGKCDNDGAELVQRPDDKAEVVAHRLRTYHLQTKPVVDYYREKSTVFDVDANKEAEETSGLIFDKLDVLAEAQE